MNPTSTMTPAEAAAIQAANERRLAQVRAAAKEAGEALEEARGRADLDPSTANQRVLKRAKAAASVAKETLETVEAGARAAAKQLAAAITEADHERQVEMHRISVEHTRAGLRLISAAIAALNRVNEVITADNAFAAWSRESDALRSRGGSPARLQGPSSWPRVWDMFLDSTTRLSRGLADDLARYERTYNLPTETQKESDDA